MKRFIISIVLLMCCIDSTQAQLFPFRTYSIDEGLTQTVVNDIIQGKDGFIWIATSNGLNKLDGIELKQYHSQDGLNDNKVYSLLQGQASS